MAGLPARNAKVPYRTARPTPQFIVAHLVWLAYCSWPQVIKCAEAGADLVRITVQGKREAKSCKLIREKLNELVRDRKILCCKYTAVLSLEHHTECDGNVPLIGIAIQH